MIVISASLPKSGSTLVANYQEDLLAAQLPHNGQAQLRRVFKGRYIGYFSPAVLARLLYINAHYGSTVVKTHAAASPILTTLINLKLAQATYSYRDPRDVVLSAIDHSRRSQADKDQSYAFSDYTSIDASIPKVQQLIHRWHSWQAFGKAHMIRYEALMADPLSCLQAMTAHLGWHITIEQLATLIVRHLPQPGVSHNFNKGTTLRYKSEMSAEEIARCTRAFRAILIAFQYEV